MANRRKHGKIEENFGWSSRLSEERGGRSRGSGVNGPAGGCAAREQRSRFAARRRRAGSHAGATGTRRRATSARPAAVRTITRPGSDLMVQTIRDLGIEYAVRQPRFELRRFTGIGHQLRQSAES